VQVSYGELDWPDEYSKRRFLRGEFLDAVSKYEPRVCETLCSEPLALFGRLHGDEQTLAWKDFANIVNPTSECATALIDSLLEWSRHWQLDAD